MTEVLSSESLRARLREQGIARSRDFLWESIARRTMDTLVEVARA